MLKVKNKKIAGEIARITYRANKKRNLLTVFAIFLTTFFIAVILAVGISYWNTVSERQIRMNGMDYDIELSEPRADQVEKIRSMDRVKYAGIAVKCAVFEKYQDRSLGKTRLYWLDRTCWEYQAVPALEHYEGSYPERENEIMLSGDSLKAMGIQRPKIGMKLPVTYYTLKEGSDGSLLSGEFVLCGWYTDYSGNQRGYVSEAFYKTTGVKQTDFTQGALKITLENPLYSESEITAMIHEIGIGRNQSMDADYDTILNFCRIAAGLAVLLLMIFASGYLFIYNTLYISVFKDIRYYGQLKTVGMTSVQLRGILYRQALWNAAAGIPLGLAAAFAVSKIVIPQLLHIVNPVVSASDAAPVKIGVYLLAGCFAFVTNQISCKKPAKMAGDCSPVEALRYTAGTSTGKSHKRESGGIGSMAWQNMFRDKKQAFVILASFTIAISIFIVVNGIIRENDAKLILNEICPYDIQVVNQTTVEDNRRQIITKDRISQIGRIDGVKGVRNVTSAEVVIPYQEEVYGDYFKELYQSRYSPGNYDEDMELYRTDPKNDFFTSRFISVDEKGFELLNKNLEHKLDQKAFEDGKIAVALKFLNFAEGDFGMAGKTVHFFLPDGKHPAQEYSIQIAAVGDGWCNPAIFAGGMTPELIVSEKYAKRLMGELFTELIEVEYEDAFSADIEKKVKEVFEDEKQVSFESKLERYSEMKHSENQVKVLGNSIGFIIAALAVLNYLNMIAASIQNRAIELAILESVGMTAKQIKQMLQMEGLLYAAITITFSFVVGIPASYAVFDAMNIYRISFSVPWVSNLVLFGTILVLCMLAPVWMYQRTQNASVIERLRND